MSIGPPLCKHAGCSRPRLGRAKANSHARKWCGQLCRMVDEAGEAVICGRPVPGRDLASDAVELCRLSDVLGRRRDLQSRINQHDYASLKAIHLAYWPRYRKTRHNS